MGIIADEAAAAAMPVSDKPVTLSFTKGPAIKPAAPIQPTPSFPSIFGAEDDDAVEDTQHAEHNADGENGKREFIALSISSLTSLR